MTKDRFGGFSLGLYFWVTVLFLIFPIIIIVPISFSSNEFLRFPPKDLGLRWYRELFNDPNWISAASTSFKVALISCLIATAVGSAAVLALERNNIRFKNAIVYLITAPIVVPHIFIALGVFLTASRFGLVNNILVLSLAHATIAMPFVILIVGAAHRQLDLGAEKAARILGAGPVRAFFAATFPNLLPGVVAAAIFAFFVSFDELIIAEFLMKGRTTLPIRIWSDLQLDMRPTIAAVSSLLIFMTTLALLISEIYRRRGVAGQGEPE